MFKETVPKICLPMVDNRQTRTQTEIRIYNNLLRVQTCNPASAINFNLNVNSDPFIEKLQSSFSDNVIQSQRKYSKLRKIRYKKYRISPQCSVNDIRESIPK